MDFKISDTNRGKKSLLHNGYKTENSTLANGRTVVESRYRKFFGLDRRDTTIAWYNHKIPVKAINFRAI